jgi:hypothetical protein
MDITLDFNLIFNTCVALTFALILKTLLDMRLAIYAVKYLHYLPVRSLFRENPLKLNGNWKQSWKVDSDNFLENDSTTSLSSMKQFGKYCYSEFQSGSSTYALFAKLNRDQLIGEWYDKNDPLGYSGSLHLTIESSTKMRGMWIGNSKTTVQVKCGDWSWEKKVD